jgi:hypothetical protein
MVDKATDGDNSVVTLHPDTMEHLQLLCNAQILSSSKEAQTPRGENGRENTQTIHVPVFFFVGNGNGIGGRENESDITGYREWNISVGNMSITIGKR